MVSKAELIEKVGNTIVNKKGGKLEHTEKASSLEVVSCENACFYDLYDKYEGKPVKIFQTKDKLLWIVMEDDKYGK